MTIRQAYKAAHDHCEYVHYVMIEQQLNGNKLVEHKKQRFSYSVCMMGEANAPYVRKTGATLGIALTAAKAEWTAKITAAMECRCPSCGESLK